MPSVADRTETQLRGRSAREVQTRPTAREERVTAQTGKEREG